MHIRQIKIMFKLNKPEYHLMNRICCMDAGASAWRKMVIMLFKPFNFAKWVTLGFCAWVAYLGESGSVNFNSFGGNRSFNPRNNEMVKTVFYALREIFNGESGNMFTRTAEQCHISPNLLMGICVGIGVVIFIITAVSLVLVWLKSRFGFILLDNLVYDRTDITGTWKKFKTSGNSAFLWRVVIGFISITVFMFLLLLVFFSVLPWIKSILAAKAWLIPDNTVITLMIIDGSLILVFGLCFSLISFLFEQFVVPIMYWSNLKSIAAWKEFLALAKVNLFVFVRYILLYMVFSMLAGGAVLIACLATCCVGFLLLLIPFVGTVLLLPVFVFFRLFGVELLARFSPKYNIPSPPEPPQTI